MKAALRSGVLLGFMVLAGCQSPDSMVVGRGPSQSVRIEFTRPTRIYEDGDGVFAMANGTSQVLWFVGQGPESPAYRLKTGAATASERSTPTAGKRSAVPERFPLSPRETRYFEIKTGNANAAGPVSVGIMFYPSLSGTNGTTVWSSPTTVPTKPRRLEQPG